MDTRYALGVAFIVLVAVIWAGGSVLVQYIYDNLGFESPFFLTFICTAMFSLHMPIFAVLVKTDIVTNPPLVQPDEPDLCNHPAAFAGLQSHESRESLRCSESQVHTQPLRDSEDGSVSTTSTDCTTLFSHKRTLLIAAVMCPLWFVANWSYYASLSMTSVSSSTVINTTSSLFTFFFSWLMSLEKFSWGIAVGVILCLIGTTMVALADESEGQDSLRGDVVAIFSSMMYGCYTTVLRRLVPNEDVVSMQLLFGYIGVLNTLMLGPLSMILWASGVLTLHSLTGVVVGWIIVGALFNNVLSDYLWARSIVLTSPTVATVGLSLTIPLAFLSDFLLGKSTVGYLSGFGAMFVVFGFIVVNTGLQPLLERLGLVRPYAPLTDIK